MVFEIQNLCFARKNNLILNNINFSIAENEIIGLIGNNGSGKSTLLALMCGLLEGYTGKILFKKEELKTSLPNLKKKLSVVFQTPSLDKYLSVKENLHFTCLYNGYSSLSASKQINKFLELSDLKDLENEPIRKLSGGMQRRVDIARALIGEPEILFLDEPTSGLDEIAAKKFWEFIFVIRKERPFTLVMATHDFEEAGYCNKLLVLNPKKEPFGFFSPDELKKQLSKDLVILRSKAAEEIRASFSNVPSFSDKKFTYFEVDEGYTLMLELAKKFGSQIDELKVKPASLSEAYVKLMSQITEHGGVK